MHIEIKLLSQLKTYLPDHPRLGKVGSLELGAGATVQDALAQLAIPVDMPKILLVNRRQARLEDELQEGDRVTVFPPMGGG